METILPFLKRAHRKGEIWQYLAEGCYQADIDAEAPPRNGPAPAVKMPDGFGEHFDASGDLACYPYPRETYREGLARLRAAREELLRRHSGREDSVLVVGHGHMGGRLIEILLGTEPLGRIKHDNTGVTCVRQDEDGSFRLQYANRL
jgi:broad specificity phosphatase PhoE